MTIHFTKIFGRMSTMELSTSFDVPHCAVSNSCGLGRRFADSVQPRLNTLQILKYQYDVMQFNKIHKILIQRRKSRNL